MNRLYIQVVVVALLSVDLVEFADLSSHRLTSRQLYFKLHPCSTWDARLQPEVERRCFLLPWSHQGDVSIDLVRVDTGYPVADLKEKNSFTWQLYCETEAKCLKKL